METTTMSEDHDAEPATQDVHRLLATAAYDHDAEVARHRQAEAFARQLAHAQAIDEHLATVRVYSGIVDRHGPECPEAEAFRREHADDKAVMAFVRITDILDGFHHPRGRPRAKAPAPPADDIGPTKYPPGLKGWLLWAADRLPG